MTRHFGPDRPDGAGDRWLQTVRDRDSFAYLPVYGPEEATFDASWRPGDFVAT